MARRDGTGKSAQDAGARVVRHPYNKGNGAAVKTAIRAATSDWIAIVDADGQHSPADAQRLIARLGEYDLVVGARDPPDAGHAPAAGWATRCSTGSPAT